MREGGRKRRWVHVLVEGNERGIKGGIKRGTRICALRRKRESYGEIGNKKEKGNRIFIILFYFILGSTVIGLMPIVGCSKNCKNMSRCITPLA